eukprot:TRINITY_DN8826_c0_g1_i1.p1 TRINITY_DN8826_c0_g1~~TRINITY_DN8826_c0_g1_i1.p1  ORF type:complete len:141 (+),score=5.79 TRINITY_DN8826_c0_g1_i1:922-1344(+)
MDYITPSIMFSLEQVFGSPLSILLNCNHQYHCHSARLEQNTQPVIANFQHTSDRGLYQLASRELREMKHQRSVLRRVISIVLYWLIYLQEKTLARNNNTSSFWNSFDPAYRKSAKLEVRTRVETNLQDDFTDHICYPDTC